MCSKKRRKRQVETVVGAHARCFKWTLITGAPAPTKFETEIIEKKAARILKSEFLHTAIFQSLISLLTNFQ